MLSKKIILAAALIGAALTGAQEAVALPLDHAGISAQAPIEHVGWRCGPGWHVNPWGRCVPNGRPRRFRRW